MQIVLDDSDIDRISDALVEKVLSISKDQASTSLLTIEGLAEKLQVPKGWIYDRTRISTDHGGIPHYKVGKYVRFNLTEVLQWLKEKG
jgi:excisionase family DNA binding protein